MMSRVHRRLWHGGLPQDCALPVVPGRLSRSSGVPLEYTSGVYLWSTSGVYLWSTSGVYLWSAERSQEPDVRVPSPRAAGGRGSELQWGVALPSSSEMYYVLTTAHCRLGLTADRRLGAEL